MNLLDGEEGLLTEVVRAPDDEAIRAVYADWLEERGDVRADWLRADAELLSERTSQPPEDADDDARRTFEERRLERMDGMRGRFAAAGEVDPEWAAAVLRVPIENCDVWSRVARMQFRCPERWDALQATMSDGVRFCGACRRHVFYSPTVEAARVHARAGNRVAVAPHLPRESGDLDDVEMILEEMEDSEHWPEGLDPNAVRPLARIFRAVQRVFTPPDGDLDEVIEDADSVLDED